MLLAESLPQFAPTTNLYRLDDGRHVLVTAPDEVQPVPAALAPILVGVKVDHTEPGPTTVILCDENATPIDADGDPTNGLTPLATYPPGTTHDDALRRLAP